MDGREIFDVAQLRGRVPFDRDVKLVKGNTAAVVSNLNSFDASGFDQDVNARCPGIYGVLDQLLDDRCWPFYHLAGSDLPDRKCREFDDAVHGQE
ncbi:MAG: hypothetical protein R2849_16425 [Thermomicrobiales bacterium]